MSPSSFHYKKLLIQTSPHVYNPAEDTFLLMDALTIHQNNTILELGTGTGIIALYCAHKGAQVTATDINPHALILTQQNKKHNQHLLIKPIQLIRGNLFTMIKPHITYDIIIFNPPYLPTQENEHIPGWINYAYNGGPDGLHTIKEFLTHLPQHLNINGKSYFITTNQSNNTKLQKIIKQTNLTHQKLSQLHFQNETLTIHQLTKTP